MPTDAFAVNVVLGPDLRQARSSLGAQSTAVQTVAVDRLQLPVVADLYDALLPAEAKQPPRDRKKLVIDGQLFEAATLLEDCPLFEGAEICLPRNSPNLASPSGPNLVSPSAPNLASPSAPNLASPSAPTQSKSVLAVVGGLESGQQVSFGLNRVVVGRHPDADLQLRNPAVSLRHLLLYGDPLGTAQVTDLNSLNRVCLAGQPAQAPLRLADGQTAPLRPGQRIYIAGTTLEWRLWTDNQLPLVGKPPKLEFQRPPRQPPPPAPPPLRLEDLESEKSQLPLRPLSWATFAAPLAMGVVMAVLFNPYMALFAFLGPVMAVTAWWEGRRRNKKEGKRRGRKLKAVLKECEQHYYAAAAQEVRRRRFEYPDPPAVLRWAALPTRRLWSRSRADFDFLHLSVGRHSEAWQPAVLSGSQSQGSHAAQMPASLVAQPAAVAAVPPSPREAPQHRKKFGFRKSKTSQNLALRDEVIKLFESLPPLDDVSLVANFSKGSVGLAGAESDCVLRWLVLQAACRYGPADLKLVVAGISPGWEWLNWLPHVEVAAGIDPLQFDAPGALAESQPHIWLLLLQPPKQLPLLPAGVSALILSHAATELPSNCEVCLEVLDGAGKAMVQANAAAPQTVFLDGINQAMAARAARKLARFTDPLAQGSERSIPGEVLLTQLLGIDDLELLSASRQAELWLESSQAGSFAAPIGVGQDGAIWLDLPTAGPHALIAGTTGSGKSELLRCIVASLAVRVDPERLNFVLIDYKGGSAFDLCSDLPHVVGLVTDLDEQLGQRALICLRAELAYRERVLRSAGVSDLAQLPQGPVCLPRLVVIVDEFASLANELPTFLESLVGIAQRGRSLGVHLLLATQRPAGIVSPEIRSNTSIRIGLRMLDALDSQDVLDTAAAAKIPPGKAGRGYLKIGSDEAQPFQVAAVSGSSLSVRSASAGSAAVLVRDSPVASAGDSPVALAGDSPALTADDSPALAAGDSPTAPAGDSASAEALDLAHLIGSVKQAWALRESQALRCPWPAPLPEKLSFHQLKAQVLPDGQVPLGLADLPQEQAQRYIHWQPGESNLFFLGQGDSGARQSLLCTALLLCSAVSATQLHLYGLDFGTAGLASLAGLAHAGTLASQAEPDKCIRLLDFLFEELADRQAAYHSHLPKLVLLVDNLGGLWHFLEQARDFQRLEKFIRLMVDGPSWEISALVVAESAASVPRRMLSGANQQLLFHMPHDTAYALAGLKTPEKVIPGRAFLASSGVEVQAGGVEVADAADIAASLKQAARPRPAPNDFRPNPAAPKLLWPQKVAPIPRELSLANFEPKAKVVLAQAPTAVSEIPLGLGYDSTPVGLKFAPFGHAVVCGKPRSGKSSTLRLLSYLLANSGAQTVALCPGSSPLAAEASLLASAATVAELWRQTENSVQPDQPIWLLIDDLEQLAQPGKLPQPAVADCHQLLSLLLQEAASKLHFVVAATADFFRSCSQDWLQKTLASRTGVWLAPSAMDCDFLDVLPAAEGAERSRWESAAVPGRAMVVNDGQGSLCQLARQETCKPAKQSAPEPGGSQ